MKITVTASKNRGDSVTSATYDNIYDKMAETGWNEYDQGFWNAPSEEVSNVEDPVVDLPVEESEDFVIDYKIPEDPEYIAREDRKRREREEADEADYYDRLHGEGLYEGNPHDVYGADADLPFDDYSDAGFDEMDAQMEADRQRDQELLDKYGGALRIWYSENAFNGKEGNVICPGRDVNKAVQMALNQIPSKDPNNLVITQVDFLEGYYDPESGMTPYDGEPVWRSGDSREARDIWTEAENVLKNLRLDTKEGWIRERVSEYGTDLQAKETIRDLGMSEGRFKDDHEFDVLWNFAIDYDDDVDAATAITSSVPGHLKDYFADRARARQFLEKFDDQFLADISAEWKSYLHELSEYYFEKDAGKEVSEPNKYEWLSGLAESYPDISMEELEDAWNCVETLDDSSMAYA